MSEQDVVAWLLDVPRDVIEFRYTSDGDETTAAIRGRGAPNAEKIKMLSLIQLRLRDGAESVTVEPVQDGAVVGEPLVVTA